MFNEFCVIAASNSDEVLHSSLLASPDLVGAEMSVQRGATSAAQAYNRGIVATSAEVMIFAHQDLFLPAGWLPKLKRTIAALEKTDPNWGVLGMFGLTTSRQGEGYFYSTGLKRVIGSDFEDARQVDSLDEMVLVLRRASGLRFDEQLPGFHLYGADICLQARSMGLKNYAFSALGIHNSNGIPFLPRAYWRCYLYIWKKWRHCLPVMTPCMAITRWHRPALHYLVRFGPEMLLRRQTTIESRVSDPAELFKHLLCKKPTKTAPMQ